MSLGDDTTKRGSTLTGLNLRNNLAARRASAQNYITSGRGQTSPGPNPETRASRMPSSPSNPPSSIYEDSDLEADPESDRNNYLSPTSPNMYSPRAHSPAGPTRDYFAADRRPSDSSTISSSALTSASGKKKPPPPPPKRMASNTPIFVIAIYGFQGQEAGDLSFREGDRIKVIKKTDSTDDWWDGELRGHKGRFPANYCETG